MRLPDAENVQIFFLFSIALFERYKYSIPYFNLLSIAQFFRVQDRRQAQAVPVLSMIFRFFGRTPSPYSIAPPENRQTASYDFVF